MMKIFILGAFAIATSPHQTSLSFWCGGAWSNDTYGDRRWAGCLVVDGDKVVSYMCSRMYFVESGFPLVVDQCHASGPNLERFSPKGLYFFLFFLKRSKFAENRLGCEQTRDIYKKFFNHTNRISPIHAQHRHTKRCIWKIGAKEVNDLFLRCIWKRKIWSHACMVSVWVLLLLIFELMHLHL